MSGRRTLLVLCCLVALIAIGVWWTLEREPQSPQLLEAPGVVSPADDPEAGRAALETAKSEPESA